MADPPWEIHQDLPYGTMADEEMRRMGLGQLQDEGVIFLWVTGAPVGCRRVTAVGHQWVTAVGHRCAAAAAAAGRRHGRGGWVGGRMVLLFLSRASRARRARAEGGGSRSSCDEAPCSMRASGGWVAWGAAWRGMPERVARASADAACCSPACCCSQVAAAHAAVACCAWCPRRARRARVARPRARASSGARAARAQAAQWSWAASAWRSGATSA